MFRNLLSRLFADRPASPHLSGQDAEVAVASLLVRLARADDHYGKAEQQRIDQVLARRRGLAAAEAAERRAAAEMIEAEAPDTVRFTRTIKERVDLQDRQDIVAALWEVAYADGVLDPEEDALIRRLGNLIYITDRERILARQRVLARRG